MKNEKGVEILDHAPIIGWKGKVTDELQDLLDEYLETFGEFADSIQEIPYGAFEYDLFRDTLRYCIDNHINIWERWKELRSKLPKEQQEIYTFDWERGTQK